MKKHFSILKSIFFIAGAIIAVGCANMYPGTVTEEIRVQRVTEKAIWDLECEKEKVMVLKINDTTYGAKGCGKKASYIMDKCMSGAMAANWASVCKAILNSDITSTSE